jgi:hypothetical protein
MKSVAAQGKEGLLSVAYGHHQQQSLVVPYILRVGKEVACDGKLVGFKCKNIVWTRRRRYGTLCGVVDRHAIVAEIMGRGSAFPVAN